MSRTDQRVEDLDADTCEWCGGPLEEDEETGEVQECPARGDGRSCQP